MSRYSYGPSNTRLAIVILALIATAIWHWWTGNWR